MPFTLETYRDYLDMKISSLKEMLDNPKVSGAKKEIYKNQLFLLKTMKFESNMFEE